MTGQRLAEIIREAHDCDKPEAYEELSLNIANHLLGKLNIEERQPVMQETAEQAARRGFRS